MKTDDKNKKQLIDNLTKNLSPSQLNYLNKIAELHMAKQKLNKLKSYNNGLANIEKQQKKPKIKKRKKERSLSPTSYTKCQCMKKLNTIADNQSSNVTDLIRKKQNLVQDRQRLKYYSNNVVQSRQAYFIEEIERKNLQIIYLQQKLDQKRRRNQSQLKKLSKQVQKAKKQKESKSLKKQHKK